MAASPLLCLQCGKLLKSGRIDKKFCNENCRNQYHNAGKIEEHAEIRKINKILKDNRRILKNILKDRKEEIIQRDALLKTGFEFDYHTHFVTTKLKKNVFTFCFNYGYRLEDNNTYRIIKSFKNE